MAPFTALSFPLENHRKMGGELEAKGQGLGVREMLVNECQGLYTFSMPKAGTIKTSSCSQIERHFIFIFC